MTRQEKKGKEKTRKNEKEQRELGETRGEVQEAGKMERKN